MKRLLSIMIAIVMLFGIVSVNTVSAKTEAVTIKDFDFPIVGIELDSVFSVNDGSGYAVSKGGAITWYDLGTDGNGLTKLDAGAKPEKSHKYLAEMRLTTTTEAFSDHPTITLYDVPANKIFSVETSTSNSNNDLLVKVRLYASNIISYIDIFNQSGVVPMEGEEPWGTEELSWSGSSLDVVVSSISFEEKSTKIGLKPGDKFKAGTMYTIYVTLDSGPTGVFDANFIMAAYLDCLDTEPNASQYQMIGAFEYYVPKEVTAAEIKGIVNPRAGAYPQEMGFDTDDEEYIIQYEGWKDGNGNFLTGRFEENTHYTLMLTLKPNADYVLNIPKENITTDNGVVEGIYRDPANSFTSVEIGFDVGEKLFTDDEVFQLYFQVDEPIVGYFPNPVIYTKLDCNYYAEEVIVHDVDDMKDLTEQNMYRVGHTYEFNILVKPDDGYKFVDIGNIDVIVNEGNPYYIYNEGDGFRIIVPFVAAPIEDGICYGFTTACLSSLMSDTPDYGYWSHNAIDWALSTGITAGTSETTFSPTQGCTRAQVVSFLWRAAGRPEPKNLNNPFTDVSEDDYFFKPVIWAAEKEITAGTSDTTFSPNATCTRAQIVSFLYRYWGRPEPENLNNPFTDVNENDYFFYAVIWAAQKNITAGTSDTTFSPSATCTREQVVTFLYRMIGQM